MIVTILFIKGEIIVKRIFLSNQLSLKRTYRAFTLSHEYGSIIKYLWLRTYGNPSRYEKLFTVEKFWKTKNPS